MASDRYVLLGLARARSDWFRLVAQWATSAALPIEFVKCVSAEELRARLASGRPFSAVLLDAGLHAVDRDLLDAARDVGVVPLVLDDGRVPRDWTALGAAAVLPAELTREVLLDALATHATVISRRTPGDDVDVVRGTDEAAWLAPVVTVVGAGGAGASTVAIATAQGLGGQGIPRGGVLLADLCRVAQHAMLHDVGDLFPGIQELVEAHRGGRPGRDDVRGMTFDIADRGYRLLLGLRHARYWSSLRARAFEAAFASLRGAFGTLVCDVDADLEGEADGGSADVEDRNRLSRHAIASADAVLVVGRPGLHGLHGLVRVVADVVSLGVSPQQVIPVVNVAPRQPRARAEITAALAQLLPGVLGRASGGHPRDPRAGGLDGAARTAAAATLASPVFLPRRRIDQALRDGTPLPAPLPALCAGAAKVAVARVGRPVLTGVAPAPERITPGSLGAAAEGM